MELELRCCCKENKWHVVLFQVLQVCAELLSTDLQEVWGGLYLTSCSIFCFKISYWTNYQILSKMNDFQLRLIC